MELSTPLTGLDMTRGRTLLVYLPIAALALSSCRSQTPYQRTMPQAMASHTRALRSSGDLRVAVDVTRSYLWNRVAGVLAERCGVAEEDPGSGRLVSHHCYSTDEATPTVARQRRSQITLRVPPGATSSDDVAIDVATESRERRAGESPTEWRPTSRDEALVGALGESFGEAVTSTRPAQLAEIVFQGQPAEIVRRLSARATPYEVASSDEHALVTEWRVTRESMQPGTLWLRSRLRVLVEPRDGGATVDVVAQLQERVEEPAAEGEAVSEPVWADLDPAPVRAHAVALIADALSARPIQLPNEEHQQFASAAPAEPPLEDPRAGWTPMNLPDGVGTTTEGAAAELIPFENANPEQLVGRVFDGALRPARGRVTPVGELVHSHHHETRSQFRELQFESEISVGASFLGIGGNVAHSSGTSIAVFTALVEEERVALPEYANFADVASNASFYVAAVVLGRTLDVAMQSEEEAIRLAVEGTYNGLRAEAAQTFRNRQLNCQVRARGYRGASHDCSATTLPSSGDLLRQVSSASGAAPVMLVVRRIPDRFRSDSPRTFDIAITSVGARASNQGWFEGELDLRVVISRADGATMQEDCGQGENPCVLTPPYSLTSVSFETPAHILVSAADRDLLSVESLGIISVALRDLIGDESREQRPVAVCQRRLVERGNLRVRACVRER
ncbi:MAG: hypothetical protein SangKO_049900 [Sandaracinaceae bacterium]